MCINTLDDIIKIDAPSIELQPFEENFEKEGAREIYKNIIDPEEREKLVKTVYDLLYKKDLNEEELEEIQGLVDEYA